MERITAVHENKDFYMVVIIDRERLLFHRHITCFSHYSAIKRQKILIGYLRKHISVII